MILYYCEPNALICYTNMNPSYISSIEYFVPDSHKVHGGTLGLVRFYWNVLSVFPRQD
jgi:hypothetical protein